jgi:serine/threonine protein kinase
MPTPPLTSEMPAKQAPPSLAAREALPVGSRLSEFKIRRVLGSGGFGIVYLAHDDSLRRQVAIKEYLPATWAGRGPDGNVTARSNSFADIFAAGLSSFVNEARLLARFDHPSLVKVHRFWEANGTAYMVMPYYEGVSLRQVRESMSVPPDEAWLRRLLDGLLGALEVMHEASVFHRDVAPDNILILPSGAPVLLDFGAARHVLLGQTQVLTAIVKPSYAPIEQYAGISEVRQGPWTDIYATAATLHYCLSGKAPSTSAARTVHDTQRPLHQREEFGATASGTPFDNNWLEALDWGLAVMPQARPQSIAQWREALEGRLPVPSAMSRSGPITVAPLRPAFDGHFPATQLDVRMRLPPDNALDVTLPLAGLLDTQQGPSADSSQDAAQTAHVSLWESEDAGAQATAPPTTTPLPAPPAATRWRGVAWPWTASGLVAVALVGSLWSLLASQPTPTVVAAPMATAAAATTAAAAPIPNRRVEAPVPPTPQPVSAPADVALEPALAPVKKVKTLVAVARPSRRVALAKHAAAKTPEPTSPRQLCNQPAWLSRLNCMRKTCALSKWERHPQCTNW